MFANAVFGICFQRYWLPEQIRQKKVLPFLQGLPFVFARLEDILPIVLYLQLTVVSREVLFSFP